MSLELYINYADQYTGLARADLYPDEGITLKRQILNETGLDNTARQFTRDFTIPASAKNNELLQHWELKSNESVVNPNKAIPARLEIESVLTLTGTVELLSVTWKNRQPFSYKIVFYGSESSIRSRFGETLLSDIDWTDFVFDYTQANIVNSWLPANATNYYVPVISWKRWYKWYPDLPAYADADLFPDNIAYNSLPTSTGVLLTELRVGLSLKEMITTIASHIGATFLFGSNIDEHLLEAFVIPSKYEDQALTISPDIYKTDVEESINSIALTADTEEELVMPQVNYDPRNRWDGTATYTAEFSGPYIFEVEIIRDGGTSNVSWDIYLNENDVRVVADAYGQNTGFTAPIQYNCTAGNTYTFGLQCSRDVDVFASMLTTNVPSSPIGEPYDPSDNMPVMKATDFMTGVLQAFNCIIYESGLDEWTIDDISNIFNENGEVLELEDYVDESVLIYEKLRVYDRINFKHQDGEDEPNKYFFDSAGRQFGELDYLPDVDFSEGTLDKESIFTVFPPSYIDIYNDTGVLGRTDLWHHYQLEAGTPPEPKLAEFLLLYRNDVEATSYPWYLQDTIDAEGAPTFTLQSNWGRYSVNQRTVCTADTRSLSYSRENPFIGTVPDLTITNKFWTAWLTQLYKRTAYLLDLSFPVDFGVYLRLRETTMVFLNGFYHFVASWEYNSGTGMLKMTLLRYNPVTGIIAKNDNGILKLEGL